MEKSTEGKLNILFFHNTLPEYRIGWFTELDRLCNIKFVFTNEALNKKNYGFDTDYERTAALDITFLPEGLKGYKELKDLLKNIDKYDFAELPPLDSPREIFMSRKLIRACKKAQVKTGFFWEMWEAPKDKQPIKRKIKNLIKLVIPRMVYKKTDIIFAAGSKCRQYFISHGTDLEKVHVIPDAGETPQCAYEDIREKYRIGKEQKIILYLGRIMPEKGVDLLIKAYKEIEDEKNFLLIAGGGDFLGECRSLAESLGIKNIAFCGAVDPKIRSNYFSQCDVFAYPVTYRTGWVDVWGLTINEAIQYKKPVIATEAVGSAWDLIEDGVNGWRIVPEDKNALKKALNGALLLEDKETLIKKNEELLKYYSYANMAEEYLKIILEIIKDS